MTYTEIKQHINAIAQSCGREKDEILLIAVSKSQNIDNMRSAYEEGARDFGESRLQEVIQKEQEMPPDCLWHLIGTLQSNKIPKCINRFTLIHSIDTPALARKLAEASKEKNAITPILLQVNTSGEPTKHGLSSEEWQSELEILQELSHIRIEGLMTMAPLTHDENRIRSSFQKLYELRELWKKEMKDPQYFKHLSMGMSHDYPIAIQEGATLLRIGSAIFR
jgi:PLP dependent protein